MPPLNTTYKSSINIPFIGKQNLYLKRLNYDRAHLIVNGLVKTNGYIYYNKLSENNYEYSLDEKLLNVMNKYKITINNIDYDNKNDISTVDIKINLINFEKN